MMTAAFGQRSFAKAGKKQAGGWDMKEYKIGEVAKLLGLTTQALRFYEQEGMTKICGRIYIPIL